jgi:hypothetical protein
MAEPSWARELEEYLRPGEPGWRRELRERYGVVQEPREAKADPTAPAEAGPEGPRRAAEPEEVDVLHLLDLAEKMLGDLKDVVEYAEWGKWGACEYRIGDVKYELGRLERAIGEQPELRSILGRLEDAVKRRSYVDAKVEAFRVLQPALFRALRRALSSSTPPSSPEPSPSPPLKPEGQPREANPIVPAEEWRRLSTPDLLSSLEVGVSVLRGRGLTPEEKRRALAVAKDLIDVGSDPSPEEEREEAEYEEARRRALRAPGPKLLPV